MRWLCVTSCFAFSALAVAQVPAGITTTKGPVGPAGVRAICDLPAPEHLMNRGGNDRTRDNPRGEPGKGYGLCVFTSVEVASRWQWVRELAGFQEWMTRHPGGGYPEKLDRMIAAYCREHSVPTPTYVQHTGGDESFLDLAVKTDRLPCVTYAGMDGFYKDAWGRDTWIDHMVNLAHLDADTAAIIDNNRPGAWVWMSRKDFLVRWRARGSGWAVVLLHSPPPPHEGVGDRGEGVEKTSDRLFLSPLPSPLPPIQGQCPNGRCLLPEPPLRLSPNPYPLSPTQGQWVPTLAGDEWGYWVGNRCVARCFADGRCEAVDERGFAIGVAIDPPAPLPVGVKRVPTPAAVAELPNFGIDSVRVHEKPGYSICGVEVTREEAHAALAGGSLVDDSDRWHLTGVGDAAFVKRFLGDVAALPADTRAKLHVQGYGPGDWPVALFKLPAGVNLRRPSPVRTAEQVGVIGVADYTPAKLAELLAPVTGVSPATPKPPVKPEPAAEPQADPPSPPPDRSAFVALILAAVALILGVLRRGV
jgi:hypothetical protein